MRLILSLLALASLAAPASAQTLRYRDIRLTGLVSVQMIGGVPKIVVCGDSSMNGSFLGWTSQGNIPLVHARVLQVWAYEADACQVDHQLAVYSSSGWIEAGFRMDNPGVWHPLPPMSIPGDSTNHSSGDYVTWSLGVCRQWSGWGVTGLQPCSTLDTGCWGGTGYPDLWAVVLDVWER